MVDYSKLPSHMQGAVKRYIEKGIPPGDFLTAVIENNLLRAVSHADDTNVKALKTWVQFFYNEAPGNCWKTKEAMNAWVKQGGLHKGLREVA